jgi:rhamnogalacturonyl hydrolase YesR
LLGYAALIAYQGYHQPRHLEFAQRVADYLLNSAGRTADGTLCHVPDMVWVDTLVGTVPFFLELNRVTGDARYLEEALTQAVNHAGHLQDPATGLYRHAWHESSNTFAGPAFWGRGNGWAVLANTEILAALPTTHPGRATVLNIAQRQMAGLKSLQDGSGLWHTVVTRPDFYLETSASALIGYGFKRGVEAGWLNRNEYAATAELAFNGVWRRILADGTVTGVSAPTGPTTIVEAYQTVPYHAPQLYGQGVVLALGNPLLP